MWSLVSIAIHSPTLSSHDLVAMHISKMDENGQNTGRTLEGLVVLSPKIPRLGMEVTAHPM